MTYTLAIMSVSAATYAEIREHLKDAGYEHAIHEGGTLDMTHIGLQNAQAREPISRTCNACNVRPGQRCRNWVTGATLGFFHDSR